MKHYSVLLNESIENLNIKEDGMYVDATMGYAGHSSNILKRIKKGFLFAFDNDSEAIKYADELLSKIGNNYQIFHTNFVNMKETLAKQNINRVDGILFDLGFSSPQIDDESRGFSFMSDSRLDMRMNQDQSLDAQKIVNDYSYEELIDIFFSYGEEKMSKVIAKKIIEKRKVKPIYSTLELVDIIKSATGANYFYKNHPERKIFQAIRIEVNNELSVLESVLPEAINLLNKGGRICVITFHSLEDKIVKKIFKKYSEVDEVVKGLPQIPDEYKPLIKIVNKKVILPSQKELEENSRSASAKLRVIERI
ncbi:MAG TPA: 16S rRNA (cytosine(1402)-N(4))-methyltransferase RsmH [Bacilli bacterium]|nr:16S rRNA (cytosine(1402)-N(4))-methyltransferase RsmH [Bacilli bacterium]